MARTPTASGCLTHGELGLALQTRFGPGCLPSPSPPGAELRVGRSSGSPRGRRPSHFPCRALARRPGGGTTARPGHGLPLPAGLVGVNWVLRLLPAWGAGSAVAPGDPQSSLRARVHTGRGAELVWRGEGPLSPCTQLPGRGTSPARGRAGVCPHAECPHRDRRRWRRWGARRQERGLGCSPGSPPAPRTRLSKPAAPEEGEPPGAVARGKRVSAGAGGGPRRGRNLLPSHAEATLRGRRARDLARPLRRVRARRAPSRIPPGRGSRHRPSGASKAARDFIESPRTGIGRRFRHVQLDRRE